MHMTHDPAAPAAPEIAFDQFLAVDIRVGRIVAADPFPQARKPAYRLTIDFGAGIGTRRSSAQITEHYRLEDLPGRLVAAVVGFPDAEGHVVLVTPTTDVPVGGRLF
jgi:tRNA-binding protein